MLGGGGKEGEDIMGEMFKAFSGLDKASRGGGGGGGEIFNIPFEREPEDKLPPHIKAKMQQNSRKIEGQGESI